MKFILLGINGSIGKTTLKVFETIKNKWEIVGFSIGDDAKNVDELINKELPPLQEVHKNKVSIEINNLLFILKLHIWKTRFT